MNEIIYDLDKLREPSEPLEMLTKTGILKDEGTDIISKIKEVMEADKNILALSAPQIGINKRIFCIRFSDTIKTFINPVITKKTGSVIAPETFLCMPNKEILVSRPDEITVVYYTDEFKYEDNKLLGLAARLFDQTYNILDGILPDELGLVSDVAECGSLFEATDEEMQEYVAIYKKFISAKSAALNKELETDEEVNKQYRQLKFTEDVITGKTQVVDMPEEEPKLNRAQRRAAAKSEQKAKLHKFLGSKK